MNSNKILLGLVVIVLSCTLSHSLQCNVCKTLVECKTPTVTECTRALAQQTTTYLDQHHKNVNKGATSSKYECIELRMNLPSYGGNYQYMGCIFSNMKGCELKLRDDIMLSTHTRECEQTNYNGNPAGRAEINGIAMFATVLMVVLAKYLHNH